MWRGARGVSWRSERPKHRSRRRRCAEGSSADLPSNDGRDPEEQVATADALKSRRAEKRLELLARPGGAHRVDQISIGFLVAGHLAAEPRNHVARVKRMERATLQAGGAKEVEDHQYAAGREDSSRLGQ